MRKVTTFRPAIIVSDLVMPRMGGLDLLHALKDQLTDLTFILLTAQGTVDSAVEAIKEGAYDYLSKPVDPQRLQILLQKAVERQETLREVRQLRRQLREQGSFGRIIGNSPGIRTRLPRHRAVGADLGIRADCRASRAPARSWSRRPSTSSVRARRSRSSPSTAPRFRRRCSRARSSATRRGPSPARRSPHRRLRARASRHAVPRRDRRDDAGDAGQAAARAAGAHVPSSRRPTGDLGRRPRHRRDQRRSAGRGQQRQAPRGSVLPAERVRDRSAAAARAPRRHSAARPVVPERVQPRQRQGGARRRSGGDVSPRAVPVAGQHPRTAQRHRARDDPRRQRIHRDPSTCRRPSSRAARKRCRR